MFLEGQSVALGLPFAILGMAFALIAGRKKLGQRPVLAFFFVVFQFAFGSPDVLDWDLVSETCPGRVVAVCLQLHMVINASERCLPFQAGAGNRLGGHDIRSLCISSGSPLAAFPENVYGRSTELSSH